MQTRRAFLRSMASLTLTFKIGPDANQLGYPGQSGIQTLRLVSNKLDEQEKFYSRVMHLPVRRINSRQISVRAGSTVIHFYEDPAFESPVYHFAFNIPENQLAASQLWLRKNHIQIAKSPSGDETFHFSQWNADATYWEDPSGNILEFIARHDLKNRTQRRFSENSILYASEIGIVVDSVHTEVAALKKAINIDVYKGTFSSDFAAVGDPYHLVIVVARGRNWLGSMHGQLASPAPISSLFDTRYAGSYTPQDYLYSLTG